MKIVNDKLIGICLIFILTMFLGVVFSETWEVKVQKTIRDTLFSAEYETEVYIVEADRYNFIIEGMTEQLYFYKNENIVAQFPYSKQRVVIIKK